MGIDSLVLLAVRVLNYHYHPKILSIKTQIVQTYLNRANLERCQYCEVLYPKNYCRSHINCLQTRILKDYMERATTKPEPDCAYRHEKNKKEDDEKRKKEAEKSLEIVKPFNLRRNFSKRLTRLEAKKQSESGIIKPATFVLTKKHIRYIKTHPLSAPSFFAPL